MSLLLVAAFAVAVAIYYVAAPPVRVEHADIPPERMLTGGDEGAETRAALELLPEERINVNTASAEELKRLPGIGDVLAEAIVSYRDEYGPFTSEEDLLLVKGIGPARLAAIADHIAFDDETGE